VVEIAIPASISFDEDLLFELKHKAKQDGKTLSSLVNEKLGSVSDGTFSEECLTPESLNNKIIILNNNIIILSNLYYTILQEKFHRKSEELGEARDKLESENAQILEEYTTLEAKFKSMKVLNEVKSIALTSTGGFDFTKYEQLFLKIKEKNPDMGVQDVMKFLRLKKNLKKISEDFSKIDEKTDKRVPQEMKVSYKKLSGGEK